MSPTLDITPPTDPNRLGLLYRHEAAQLPYIGPIWDVHNHVNDIGAARLFFEVADLFGVERIWTMAQLEVVDEIAAEFGDRVHFIAIPNYTAGRSNPTAFTTDWLRRIEAFAERGSRMIKLWAAPRGRDFGGDALLLDSPIRREGIKLARSLGMMIMTHVSDPDTWFATHYRDHRTYGSKAEQYEPLERLLDEHGDVPWIAAHMAGDPERLDHLQRLLDRHPNLHLDTSATKWMVRELSKHPDELADFLRRNPGRVLFGSDIVATSSANIVSTGATFDLIASRWWALRTLFETDYDGPSPIVDPDLSMLDKSLPRESTAWLRGAKLDPATLRMIYYDAPRRLLEKWM